MSSMSSEESTIPNSGQLPRAENHATKASKAHGSLCSRSHRHCHRRWDLPHACTILGFSFGSVLKVSFLKIPQRSQMSKNNPETIQKPSDSFAEPSPHLPGRNHPRSSPGTPKRLYVCLRNQRGFTSALRVTGTYMAHGPLHTERSE